MGNGPSLSKSNKLNKTINNAITNCAELPAAIIVMAPVSSIFFKMTVTSQYQYLGSYCKYKVPNSATTSSCFFRCSSVVPAEYKYFLLLRKAIKTATGIPRTYTTMQPIVKNTYGMCCS